MVILSVESVARDALRSLMLSLCNIIYKLISFVYEVFYNLGTARILFDSDVQPIFRKIGLIIGLFMVFRVAFSFIQYVVNPDIMFDKQKGIGKIIVKVIVSIVLLGSTQYLFNAAFTIQNKILESQILEKVILGGEYTETESGMRDFGSNLSSTFFTSFYRINEDPNLANSETYNLCKNILGENNEELKENIRTSSGSITGTGANVCLNLKSEYNNDDSNINEAISKGKIDKEEYIISFDGDGLVALLVGGLCLYTGFMFTFQVAVRLIQLAYLELIAPIPIIMYITPKGDEQLKKWGTQCTTTFLDFFLRVAIIYFAKFIVEIILNSNALNIYANSNAFESLYLTCIMIIATLIFVKKVPNLLKEIFPSLGGAAGFSYSLKAPDEAKKFGLFAGGAVLGAAGAAASNMLYGAGNIRKNWKENKGTTGQKLWQATKGVFGTGASMIGGAASGLNKGRKIKDLKGVKGVVQQTNDNREKRDLKQKAGYTFGDRIHDSITGFAGLDTKAEDMIKEAQWQQQAAEASRAALWKKTEDAVKNSDLTYEYYSFARSIRQTKDSTGKIQWKGLDKSGHEIIFDDADLESRLSSMATGDDVQYAADLAQAIRDNADVDKRIKDEGKKIKGLEAAKNDAKK